MTIWPQKSTDGKFRCCYRMLALSTHCGCVNASIIIISIFDWIRMGTNGKEHGTTYKNTILLCLTQFIKFIGIWHMFVWWKFCFVVCLCFLPDVLVVFVSVIYRFRHVQTYIYMVKNPKVPRECSVLILYKPQNQIAFDRTQ